MIYIIRHKEVCKKLQVLLMVLYENISIIWEYSVRLVIGISAWYDHIYPLR